MEAAVIRIRNKSSKRFRACAGVILEGGGLVVVPFGLFVSHTEETIRFDPSCVHQHDGIECAFEGEPSRWIPASVQGILPLWKHSSVCLEDVLCPDDEHATAGPLVIGHVGSTRESARIASSFVILQYTREHEQSTRLEQVDADMGAHVSLPGCPFPQFLGTKFLHATFNGTIAACMNTENTTRELSNSIYTGGPCLYILDAQVVPGLEGAPLILKDSGAMCGILGYPITSDQVGAVFHIAWPIRFIRHAMQAMRGMQQIPSISGTPRHDGAYSKPMAFAVSIHTGDGCWASGCIIDSKKGIVVTNAHALPHEANVMVRCSETGTLHRGHILHSFAGILDIAFVHVPHLKPTNSNTPLELSTDTPTIGRPISILGFPLWCASQNHHQPIVTRGHVTSVLRDRHDIEAIFTTDAKVISGASGAIVFDDETSRILGMVVSNTKVVHGSTYSIIYPTLNFCIPSILIHRAYTAVLSGHDSINSIRRAFIVQGVHHVWDTIHTDTAFSKL